MKIISTQWSIYSNPYHMGLEEELPQDRLLNSQIFQTGIPGAAGNLCTRLNICL